MRSLAAGLLVAGVLSSRATELDEAARPDKPAGFPRERQMAAVAELPLLSNAVEHLRGVLVPFAWINRPPYATKSATGC